MTSTSEAPPVAQLADDEDFVAAAAALADQISPSAVDRDRAGTLPLDELEALRNSGLLALPVPERWGGAGASVRTLTRVFIELATADPAFAQILGPHVSFVDLIGRSGSDEQQRFFYSEALSGRRFGNALSERGTRDVFQYTTTLLRDGAPSGHRILNGTKYYSTGALGADWIGVFAVDDSGSPLVAYVPGDATGLQVHQDWNAFGQRSTISGTTRLTDVVVPDEHVVVLGLTSGPTTYGTYPQIGHAAIDLGIARGALADGIAYVRDRARPWPDAGVERAAEEPGLQEHYGRLATLVDAAEALLLRAADLFDETVEDDDPERIDRARLAVAGAKAYAGDVSLEVANGLFEGTGSSGSDSRHDLDRHWRNARTHTLHDPNRWKYIHIGNWLLNDVAPAPENHVI